MPVAHIEVNDVMVVMNADEIIEVFGLDGDKEIPLILSGSMTPAANSITLSWAWNADIQVGDSEQDLFDRKVINFADAKQAHRNVQFVGAQASQLTVPLPAFPPFIAMKQLAIITDNSASTSFMLAYIVVEGPPFMQRRETLEKLADRRRMNYAPPAGEPGHIMNAGLRNRMGDAAGGF